jgi:hypothetical protein
MLTIPAIGDFVRREDSLQERFAVLFDHLADPNRLDDVGADPCDIHGRRLEVRVWWEKSRRAVILAIESPDGQENLADVISEIRDAPIADPWARPARRDKLTLSHPILTERST